MDLQTRLERLAQRRTDSAVFEAATKSYESYRYLEEPAAVKYIIGAMQPIDDRYTRRTIAQGERVREQLRARLAKGVQYRFQGSVMTDTHIRLHSDIDLLVFIDKFHFLKSPLEPDDPYIGDEVQDLHELRGQVTNGLRTAFYAATVDDSGARSIEISGGSLERHVDVVPAAWYDTIEYYKTGDEIHRGVQVFNKSDASFSANFPFKNAAEIDAKDRRCGGGMRKAARFMKTLKADSDEVNLSSYDITAIAWNMSDGTLSYGMPWDLKIFYGCRDFLRTVVGYPDFRNSLYVPDGSRRVFAAGHASVDGARALLAEMDGLAGEMARIVEAHVARTLEPAFNLRVDYPKIEGHAPFMVR